METTKMRDELAFLKAMAAHPGDSAPAFVYADWLDEQGRGAEAADLRKALGFERRTTFNKAYDKRAEGYGLHGAELRMVLIGPKGAVQFVLYTHWMPSDTPGIHIDNIMAPLPADLGYHSPKPMYEGHTPIEHSCKYLRGPCYYDGSGLNAQTAFDVLVREGSDGLWKFLEDYYTEIFIKA